MRLIFLPLIAGKPWNGNTILNESLGGSEAAVAYLAQALQQKGHEVHVVTHGQPGKSWCGVEYHSTNDYNTIIGDYEFDAVVSSRWPDILAAPWKTHNRVLWVHDLPSQAFTLNANNLVCISEYQHPFYLSELRTSIIGDGVDESLLKMIGNPERNENKLIWTSNPDRGLALAASIFQEIRKRWPDLELHVFGRASVYGWDASVEAPFLPRKWDMENVFLHEPLPRAQLLRQLAESWAMFYPTFWPETFCMAALEAQAVGTPVICSPYAALNETVKGGILSYDFLNSVSQLRNKRRWNKLSVAGLEWARENTWDVVADRWLKEVFNES